MNERAKLLSEQHWNGYIKPLLRAHGQGEEIISVVGFHYISAFQHGHRHGVEDQINREYEEAKAEALAKEVGPHPFDEVAAGRLPSGFGPFVPHEGSTATICHVSDCAQHGDGDNGCTSWVCVESCPTWRERQVPPSPGDITAAKREKPSPCKGCYAVICSLERKDEARFHGMCPHRQPDQCESCAKDKVKDCYIRSETVVRDCPGFVSLERQHLDRNMSVEVER